MLIIAYVQYQLNFDNAGKETCIIGHNNTSESLNFIDSRDNYFSFPEK